jgi:hypothetical protein
MKLLGCPVPSKTVAESMAKRGAVLLVIAGIFTLPTSAVPIEFELFSDLRLSSSKGEVSWFDDKLGKGRYGGEISGKSITKLRLSELALIAKADISWNWKAFVHAKYDPEQNKPLDVVEAYARYAPAPKSALSYALKIGLFFPKISRENIGVAWTSPFTITPSAVNSWVGEEIRVLAAEGKAVYKAGPHKLGITAALFGFNDPAGTLLAFRGWSLSDAKVGAFSRVPLAPLPSIGLDSDFLKQPLYVKPVSELDNRPGYYVAVDYEFDKRFKIGVFYYDNRGDPEVVKVQYSWDTRFWNFYAEAELPRNIKLISQYLTGRTEMGLLDPTGTVRHIDVNYSAGYFLATKRFNRYRITARYDWFGVVDNSFVARDNNNEDGTSFTVAFAAKVGRKTTLIAEYLRVDSVRLSRQTIGFDPKQSNDIIQLSFRQRF